MKFNSLIRFTKEEIEKKRTKNQKIKTEFRKWRIKNTTKPRTKKYVDEEEETKQTNKQKSDILLL